MSVADQCSHCGLAQKHSSRGWCIAALKAEIDALKHRLQRAAELNPPKGGRQHLFFMDERDVMAMHAMGALVSASTDDNGMPKVWPGPAATYAYEYADALLAARKIDRKDGA